MIARTLNDLDGLEWIEIPQYSCGFLIRCLKPYKNVQAATGQNWAQFWPLNFRTFRQAGPAILFRPSAVAPTQHCDIRYSGPGLRSVWSDLAAVLH